MGVEAMPRGRGVTVARLCCDGCGKSEVIQCPYDGDWKSPTGTFPSPSISSRKAHGLGWDVVRNRLYCPTCKAACKREAVKPKWLEAAETEIKQEKAMTKTAQATVTPLRQPTQDQKGEIVEMLVACYDRKAKRYRGNDTDKTVAEAVGNGCMPGWVSAIREENFGPSGENEEIAAVRREIEALSASWDAAHATHRKDLDALGRKLAAVMAAVGPKAGR